MSNILDKLYHEGIFEISRAEDKFVLTECCDHYFSVALTKDELIQLAKEILEEALKPMPS